MTSNDHFGIWFAGYKVLPPRVSQTREYVINVYTNSKATTGKHFWSISHTLRKEKNSSHIKCSIKTTNGRKDVEDKIRTMERKHLTCGKF